MPKDNLSRLYRQTQMDSAPTGRQIEVSILEMANGKLRAVLGDHERIVWSHALDEALRFNQKLWDVFFADWSNPSCALDRELRQNLLSIGVFVKRKTFSLMANPSREGLELLINLNEHLLNGIRQPALQEAHQ